MYHALITVQQLSKLSAASPVLVFDCRHDLMKPDWGHTQYALSHIPKAQFASLDNDLSGAKNGSNGRHPLPERGTFLEWLARQGVSADTQIVCYDQLEGMFAARLWWMCRWAGLTNVAVLEGGFQAWCAAGLPVDAAVPTPQAAPLLNLPAKESVLTSAQVLENLSKPQFVLVDARAPERYRGEIEPLDPVAGHIPGALNHVYKNNVNAQGAFAANLGEQWQSVRAVANGLPLAHQCGSGVTACHNILAQHVAGLLGKDDASLLYAGSWSEWCSDANRPMVQATKAV